jgi:hypothetical protein
MKIYRFCFVINLLSTVLLNKYRILLACVLLQSVPAVIEMLRFLDNEESSKTRQSTIDLRHNSSYEQFPDEKEYQPNPLTNHETQYLSFSKL